MKSFVKQVLVVAIGIVMGVGILIGGCVFITSTAIIVERAKEAEAREKAQKQWEKMVNDGDHPGFTPKRNQE